MQRYIALLGGINVGGHRVKMAHLSALFEELGFANVSTFIASGNVIFESVDGDMAALARQVEDHLGQALGYRVPTYIRSAEQVAAIANYEPFPHLAPIEATHALSVLFMRDEMPGDAERSLLALRTPMDEFHVHRREIYWLCRGKTAESMVDWPRLGKRIPMPPVTVRNMKTVRRLAARYGGQADPSE